MLMKVAVDAVTPVAGRKGQLHVPDIMVPVSAPPMAGTSPWPRCPADRGGNTGEEKMGRLAVSYLHMRFFGRPVDSKQIFFRLCSALVLPFCSSFRERQN